MKLFRTAFWLGVVVCNLPATPKTAPSAASHDSQQLAAKPASSRDAGYSSQDTLTPRDRGLPWHGWARSPPASKRS